MITAEDAEKANSRYRKLITLHTRLSLLSDIYATAGYSHGRATSALLQALTGEYAVVLEQLGALQRACAWENITLKATLSSMGIDAIPSSAPISFDPPLSVSPAPRDGEVSAATNANGAIGEPSTSTPAANTPIPKKQERPMDLNAKGLKHVVGQIPATLTPLFQGASCARISRDVC